MIDFKFITRDELTQAAFQEAPVWVEWEEPEQDLEIASWGVDVVAARRLRALKPDPHAEYFFPYLGKAPLSLVRGTYMAAEAYPLRNAVRFRDDYLIRIARQNYCWCLGGNSREASLRNLLAAGLSVSAM